ncbi:MAG: hypothetical protein EPN46_02425 [Candidimonas sp.]|nr:MAG: hypothetical protein EPN77_05305 [Candidimonas sp.]TAM22300.1 MAG: hypothetical protein EPN62_12275 [Candidimonas sp.]TAM80188.1 MAG: hypothetical protein EPN46_02425 [Candidimonas sp.]
MDVPDHSPNIEIPAAMQWVPLEWLATEIAFHFVPIPNEEILVSFKKEMSDGSGEALTHEEWQFVRELCGGNPPTRCSPEQFEAWVQPFNAAPNKPAWELYPEYQLGQAARLAQTRFQAVRAAQLSRIESMAAQGRIRLRSADEVGAPAGDSLFMAVEDARICLEDIGIACISRRETNPQTEAIEILCKERARPRDIAWAWATLIDIQNGQPLAHQEKRYRKIADTHEWIMDLNLPVSGIDGMPVRARKGVRVSGSDEDIEDRQLVLVSAVRDAAISAKRPWPEVESVSGTPEISSKAPAADAVKSALVAGDDKGQNETPPPLNWKMKVQVEATAMFKRLRKAGAQPAVYSIVDDLAKWCRNNGVRTDSGIYPTSGYLRTHVLSRKHWTPPAWER